MDGWWWQSGIFPRMIGYRQARREDQNDQFDTELGLDTSVWIHG